MEEVDHCSRPAQQPALGRENHEAVRKRRPQVWWNQALEGLPSQGRKVDLARPLMARHKTHCAAAETAVPIVEKAGQPLTRTHSPTAMKAVPATHLMAASGM